MRILVTGSTKWSDRAAVRQALERFAVGTILVTGDTPGADAIAMDVAAQLGFRIVAMSKNEADREKFPDAAWMGLNERMIAMGIDLVIAFSRELGLPGRARGTQHALDLAIARGIPVETVTEEDASE